MFCNKFAIKLLSSTINIIEMSKTVQKAIQENLLTLKNGKILSDALLEVVREGSLVPEKKFDIFDNNEALQVQYYNELTLKLNDYIDGEAAVIEVLDNIGDESVRELNLNWDTYKLIFEKLRGKQFSLKRLMMQL